MDPGVPSVPITTLAGVASLTELLPEMPLPTPSPQTLGNKSLLFHPRVAEEAQNLLNVRDKVLVPQLVSSLEKTSAEHIDVRDNYGGLDTILDQESMPPLLRALLEANPDVFSGKSAVPVVPVTQASQQSGQQPVQQKNMAVQNQPQHPNHDLSQQKPIAIVQPQNQIKQQWNHTGQITATAIDERHPDKSNEWTPNNQISQQQAMSNFHSGQETLDQMQQQVNVQSSQVPVGYVPGQQLPQQTSQLAQMNTLKNQQSVTCDQQATSMGGNIQSNVSSKQATAQLQKPQGEPTSANNMHIHENPISRLQHYPNNQNPQTPRTQIPTTQPSQTQISQPQTPSTQVIQTSVPQKQEQPLQTQPSQLLDTQSQTPQPTQNTPNTPTPLTVTQPQHDNAHVNIQKDQTTPAQPPQGTQTSTSELRQLRRIPTRAQNNATKASLVEQSKTADTSKTRTQVPDKEVAVQEPTDIPLSTETSLSTEKDDGLKPEEMTSENVNYKTDIKQPVIKLNRLTEEDQALLQKSLKQFVESKPERAKNLGINIKEEGEEGVVEEMEEDTGKSRRAKRKMAENNSEDEYQPDTFSALVSSNKKRKIAREKTPEPIVVAKPKLRRVEKKFVPVLEKLSIEELMETNTYHRFNKAMDIILRTADDIDVNEIAEDGMIPEEYLASRTAMQELCTEAAKLKSHGAIEMIPTVKLVRLLTVLELNIRGGDRVSPISDEDSESIRQYWQETAMERVMGAADACLVCMSIMTSKNMSKRVYLEEVIDRVVLFIKYQLHNTIFPSFDLTYRLDNKKKDGRRKKTQVSEKGILVLYTKIAELVNLIAELLNIQVLTDTSILHASSMGVSPFFVENVSELQLACLKLVTTIFTKYETHRRLLLDDILASIARLPSTKRSLRTYRLNSEEHIQMLTALVLQLIQCVVCLPNSFMSDKKDKETKTEKLPPVDTDVFICNKFEKATSTAGTFLTVFLNKCGSKTEDIDYRPLFENFVQDLLLTVNKPEWPATELLLCLLGKMLVKNFSNKSTDMSLRVASLDYLGVVAARLRKDSLLSICKVNTIDQMILDIKQEEQKDSDEPVSKNKKKNNFVKTDEERIQFLQGVLLDFLAVNSQNDEAYKYARHFYIAQWYKEAVAEKTQLATGEKKNNARDNCKSRRYEENDSDSDKEEKDIPQQDNVEKFKKIDERKKFLLSKIKPFQESISSGNRVQIYQTYIDYNGAELIAQYLSSKRYFSQSFDQYLKAILIVLKETSIAIRTKAMKCLTSIVEADPSVLGRHDMQMGVNLSFLDHSTSVREAAVDLVGKFVLSRPELISKYYEMLSARILDTGVSVRKRVIKILKDICIECPEFPKIPEICVKMIRRVNDEEGIRKLVMEVFQNMWFTPTKDTSLLRKVMNITDVVASSKEIGFEWFEQLLISLFKPKEDKDDATKVATEPPKTFLLACRQIVDCLIENVLSLEESTLDSSGSSQRLIACLTTLYLFAKIRPQLLVKHASTLQPYLGLKCQSTGDIQIISNVARMLELVVPLIEHPSDSFLAQLEEDAMKLVLQHDRPIVSSCLSCLGSIINKVTRNYKLIRDCFKKYYEYLNKYKSWIEMNSTSLEIKYRGLFRRSLFIVGLLLRHFDFRNPEVLGDLAKYNFPGFPQKLSRNLKSTEVNVLVTPEVKLSRYLYSNIEQVHLWCDIHVEADTKDQVYQIMTYFLQREDIDIQTNTLKAVGSICIRHYEFMLEDELKCFYHRQLVSDEAPLKMKVEVLMNIENYLVEEENRMIQQDLEWKKRCKEENLKEMNDVSSGMASTVIQLYLKEIMQSYLHRSLQVRQPALRVIQLVLQQGLVHPVQIVPYLICMSTDTEKLVSHSADKQLSEIEKKYPGFIHTKSSFGIRLSYQLQNILQTESIMRGSRVKEKGEYPSSLNGYLYSILRSSRQQRRALILNILRQFDESVRTTLSYMLYLADNLAYFPYQVQDEPLFIVHHIDIMISVSGTNLLQSFREGLMMTENQTKYLDSENGQPMNLISALDEDDEDEEILLSRVPVDTSQLQACITAAQGCLLLLKLKQHLKDVYGLSDGKIQQYSPSEPAKVYEKAVQRRSNALFNPKVTLQKLKEGNPPEFLDEEGRRDLIRQYLDFKQLMLQLDPEDADDDENTPKVLTALASTNANPQLNQTGAASSIITEADQVLLDNYKDSQIPKVPKLVISNRRFDSDTKRTPRTPRNTEKAKKHRLKKKRRRFASSSGNESENDFSDPDFLA